MHDLIGRCNFICMHYEIIIQECLNKLGPDVGFDSINDGQLAKPLSQIIECT